MNFNGEKEVKEILNVIHGKMIIYNTAFKNSNFCALNDVQYLDIITLILSWTLYYLKVLTLVKCYLKSWFISFQKINF